MEKAVVKLKSKLLMKRADKARFVSRDIIVAFAHHVRDKIKEKDPMYIESGVDDSLDFYEDLFYECLDFLLGIKKDGFKFNQRLIEECVAKMDAVIYTKGHGRFVEKFPDIVKEACQYLFKRIVEGVLNSEE